MDLAQIKSVLNSAAGGELKGYLLMRLEEMRSIENIREFDTSATQTLELKAQLRSYKKLKTIFEEIMTLSEDKKEVDPRDSFAILP